jgi:hypothetical protein
MWETTIQPLIDRQTYINANKDENIDHRKRPNLWLNFRAQKNKLEVTTIVPEYVFEKLQKSAKSPNVIGHLFWWVEFLEKFQRLSTVRKSW